MSELLDVCKPFNWCDRRCERCPLTRTCPVAVRERAREAEAEARGDGEPAAAIVADTENVAAELEEAHRMLEDIAEEEGIDLDAAPPRQPASLVARRLRQTSRTYAAAVHGLRPRPPISGDIEDALREAEASAFLVATKGARVAGSLTPTGELDFDEPARPDGALNAVLLERLDREVAASLLRAASALDEADLDDYADTRRDLRRLLEPLLEVSTDARSAIDEAIERGRAPSPFATL